MHTRSGSPDRQYLRRGPVGGVCGTGLRLLVLLTAVLGVLLIAASPAGAFWKATGRGTGSALTGTLKPPTNVRATSNFPFLPPSNNVNWTASAGPLVPTGYYVVRVANGTKAAACGTSPTNTTPGTSCVDLVTFGSLTYTVTAVYRSWTAISVISPGAAAAAPATARALAPHTAVPPSSVAAGDVTATTNQPASPSVSTPTTPSTSRADASMTPASTSSKPAASTSSNAPATTGLGSGPTPGTTATASDSVTP